MTNRGDQAVANAIRGWGSFPLQVGGKEPATRSGFKAATLDIVTLRRWWRTTDYNVGVACGISNLFVVDLDVKPDKGPPGIDRWCEIADAWGIDWEATYCVVTPSSGLHIYWYTELELRNTWSELAVNIDTRGYLGYVAGAGSVVDGIEYEHCGGDVPLPVPEQLAALFKVKPPETREQLERRIDYDRRGDSEQRKNAKSGLLRSIAEALQGERNNTLNWDAYKIATKFWPLDEREELLDEVRAIALEIGLTEREVDATIRSARRAMT